MSESFLVRIVDARHDEYLEQDLPRELFLSRTRPSTRRPGVTPGAGLPIFLKASSLTASSEGTITSARSSDRRTVSRHSSVPLVSTTTVYPGNSSLIMPMIRPIPL